MQDFMMQDMGIKTQVDVMSVKYTIRLDRDLTKPSDFQEELATIRMASPNDIVHILINCDGGDIATMKSFLNAMEQCEATIITEIEGTCASAATMIFLSGDEFVVSDNSEFMSHTASYFYGGKANNVQEYVDFQKRTIRHLFYKYYEGFFNEEELELMLNGKDFWLDAAEIMTRLNSLLELQKQHQELQEKEILQESLEDEEQILDKEAFVEMSKEEIIEYLFGEEEGYEKESELEILSGKEGLVVIDESTIHTSKCQPDIMLYDNTDLEGDKTC